MYVCVCVCVCVCMYVCMYVCIYLSIYVFNSPCMISLRIWEDVYLLIVFDSRRGGENNTPELILARSVIRRSRLARFVYI